MLCKNISAMMIVILMMGAAAAQTSLRNIQGGQNSVRTEEEKKNDSEIDRAYQSTIKKIPADAEKKKSDPWADVRPAPPAAAKGKQ
jgi:hypothetical protein